MRRSESRGRPDPGLRQPAMVLWVHYFGVSPVSAILLPLPLPSRQLRE